MYESILKYIKKFKQNNVLIHDAARPNFTTKLLKRLINSLKTIFNFIVLLLYVRC